MSPELSRREYENFRELIFDRVGIRLGEQKGQLVKSRLSKRLRELNLRTFSEYYDYVVEDDTGSEILTLTSAITTNVTSFFREGSQWEFLKATLPRIIGTKTNRRFRVWSAGCSSGEEPYSVVIFLMQNLPNPSAWNIRVLATDISEKILKSAMKGEYTGEKLKNVSEMGAKRFFNKRRGEDIYRVADEVKDKVLFRSFNLVHGDYGIVNKTFDLIFCRNVMIYFDEETRRYVVQSLASKLVSGGFFFLGHSESLHKMNCGLSPAASSIYIKK
ncbi:CheR family methyltransferase [Limisalsivibrio acetivorans]|uniref:CheR family methyltransferase n=1 Tax=Limisalsivibrio acetivorans TaxID=1304888 RepID=UPI0003F530DB|nr:protein-glutamate O-methyltransferase CheR [Limisalsivibrio acetivorans]